MSNTVLVTGGTGFLGAYIIKELVAKNYSVRAIRRNSKLPFFIQKEIFDKVEWLEGDLLDLFSLQEAMEGVDMVIHSAAKVSFVPKEKMEIFRTNIEGTTNMVNTAIEKNIKRFIYISSVASLGRTKNGETLDEREPWKVQQFDTNYGISKYTAEMEVWRAIGEGLNAAIVNPSTIIGYGDWNSSSCAIFKTVYNGLPWYTNGINGFVDVEDVARAVLLLAESGISGERFIVSGENWGFRELFTKIADGFNKKPPFREATPFLAALAWRMEKVKTFFTQKQSLLIKESARIAQSKTYFDNTKIKKQLPDFVFTPLEQTIRQACQSYLKNIQPL